MCSIDGCDTPVHCRMWCSRHYRQWLRSAGSFEPKPMGRRRGEYATYNAVHLRLKYDRGEARNLACVDCGGCAQSWSYDRLDPNQLWCERGRPYSLKQEHYAPRCWPCHNARDRAAKRTEGAA
jgi:hypothetical protein